jgi:hypothetical protein
MICRYIIMKNCNKLNPNCPPDISGEFKLSETLYGNLNGNKIPLDKPLKLSLHTSYKQNDLFVKHKVDHQKFPDREPAPGVWKKKYDENLNFRGWDLYLADSINDNGYSILTPVSVKNNRVMKFTANYIESGYMEGNPLQTPLVASGTGVRVSKK